MQRSRRNTDLQKIYFVNAKYGLENANFKSYVI